MSDLSKFITCNKARVVSRIVLFVTFLYSSAWAQQTGAGLDSVFNHLPTGLELNEKVPQHYRMVADYFNRDIYGNFLSKSRVSGDYTRGLQDGKVRWNNVYIAGASREDQAFPEGIKQDIMENFTYIPSEKMMLEASFDGFPEHLVQLKNLVWDVMGIEAFAWLYFDSLQLNRYRKANLINGAVEMEGLGVFENRNIRLRWSGITEMNGEVCAIIEYLAMDNPLNMDFSGISLKGRSHYWGNVLVSLSDKQIEHAEMYEDVLMDMKLPGQPENQIINATREIVLLKTNEGI